MSLLHYFSRTGSLPSSESVPSLTPEALCEANKRVASIATETDEAGPAPKRTKKTYSTYSAEDRARMLPSTGQPRHCGTTRCQNLLPVGLLKKQYLVELNNRCQNSAAIPEVTRLPKPCGRPLLLGSTLDDQVKEYVTAL